MMKKAETDFDISFMKLALREARKGIGRTSPNPCVGSVIVKDGKIIGKGFHKKAGTPHAEIHALRAAGDKARGATIYVTLEPCNHTGRTPPCSHAIVKNGLKRVVVGMVDPNPLVAGTGCDYLEDHGIEVTRDVLTDDCREINRPFIKHISTGIPWVILKAGCSLDGRIAAPDGKCAWITNDQSRAEVHRIRDRVDAILIGSQTAVNDDPSLTTRLKRGKGKDPLRIVLDSQLCLSPKAKMLHQDSDAQTWIFCSQKAETQKISALEKSGAKVISVNDGKDGFLDLSEVLQIIGKAQLNSVLVEGGSAIHGSFLRNGLVDQVSLFLAPIFLGSSSIPVVADLNIDKVQDGKRFKLTRTRRFGDDVLIEGRFT